MESVLKLEQSTAFKDWYVYYKFIDDSTGKLKRMPIKAAIDTKQKKGRQIPTLWML
jgi:hypothetical protein